MTVLARFEGALPRSPGGVRVSASLEDLQNRWRFSTLSRSRNCYASFIAPDDERLRLRPGQRVSVRILSGRRVVARARARAREVDTLDNRAYNPLLRRLGCPELGVE
jgi:hypothetical protein